MTPSDTRRVLDCMSHDVTSMRKAINTLRDRGRIGQSMAHTLTTGLDGLDEHIAVLSADTAEPEMFAERTD